MTKQIGPGADAEMSFGDHLEELRSRMIRAILSTLLAFIVVFTWHEDVLRFVVQPYTEIAHSLGMPSVLNVLGPTDAFFAYMKVSLIVGLLVSAPVWMWQFWAFVGAGLYSHEKKAVYKFAPPMILLFVGGVTFGYVVLIPIGLRYLLSFADPSVLQNWIGLSEYMSLFTTLTLVLGLTFQLPVIMALLTRMGLVTPQGFRDKRRFFILGAFFIGALLTPPDAVTQVLLATPLLFLFELGVSCAWFAQGDNREPMDWARWKKRGVGLVLIIVLLIVFSEQIMQSYRARLVDQQIRIDTGERVEGIPYFKLLRSCDFIGYDPDRLFVLKNETEQETLLAGDGSRSDVVILAYRDERVTKMSEIERSARFLVNSSSRSVHIRELSSRPGREFLGPLMLALENGSAEAVADMEALLFGLVGERPAGARALGRDEEDGPVDEARQAWLDWWNKKGKDWVYRP